MNVGFKAGAAISRVAFSPAIPHFVRHKLTKSNPVFYLRLGHI
jgi:hypothetical protein